MEQVDDVKFIMEYKAAFAVFSGSGVPPSKANILPQIMAHLLAEGRVFFSEAEKDMFKKCPLCSHLLKEHKTKFLGVSHTNFDAEVALADALEEASILRPGNRMFVDQSIRIAGIAGKTNLTCIRGAPAVLANLGLVCQYASVPVVDINDLDQIVDLPEAA